MLEIALPMLCGTIMAVRFLAEAIEEAIVAARCKRWPSLILQAVYCAGLAWATVRLGLMTWAAFR